MQQLSQEQEEIKEQEKILQQQQERILKEMDALRQREVLIRKIFYDASANMALADHMVSAMINQSQQVFSPLVRIKISLVKFLVFKANLFLLLYVTSESWFRK